MIKHIPVVRRDEVLGYVQFNTVADILHEHLMLDGRRRGEEHCRRPPYGAFAPHPLDWVNVGGADWLYCDACKCLISPPHDGYTYAEHYPASYVAAVRR